VDSEVAFWKAKYMEQLMLSTQVIMMLSNPGSLGAALAQAGPQKPPTGQPEPSNGAVSPAQVQKWGNDLPKVVRPEPPHDPRWGGDLNGRLHQPNERREYVPIADRQPAEFKAGVFSDGVPITVSPGGIPSEEAVGTPNISVDGDPE
jgi:hypothetical protein